MGALLPSLNRPKNPSAIITHAKCGSEWSGLRTAHCAACCLTFSGISAFEMHRRSGKCNDPDKSGLTLVPRWFRCYGRLGDDDRFSEDD